MNVPNPIIIDAEVELNDLSVDADVESTDLEVDAETDGEFRPMPSISIGTVEEGDEADATMTGSYAFPVLNLVIPRGRQGETGEPGPAGPTGETGAAAGFGTVSATIDANVGTPSVVVTASGPDTAKDITFAFSNIKGEQGVQGPPGQDYVLTQNDRNEIAGIVETDIAPTLAGKQNVPLEGTTANVTYAQMVAAINAGLDIRVTHTDGIYGTFTFVDGWTYNPLLKAVGANGIFFVNGVLTLGALVCTMSGWSFSASNLAQMADIPTIPAKVSAFNNDAGYVNATQAASAAPVQSVNGQTGDVTITIPTVPSDISAFNNDAGYITAAEAPVTSVNGQTGDVTGLQPAGDYAAAKAGDTTYAAKRATSIPYGQVAATSTSTVFTATIDGVTEYRNGVCFWLKNGVVTSTTDFTVNINGLGAKKCYNNMTASTQDSTIFNIAYTFLFVYDESLDSGAGGFYIYRGYNSDTNTIAYQIRTNSTALPAQTRTRYYRLLFTSADGTQWVPANTSYDNSATSTKTVNQAKIDPFGRIVYMSGTTNVTTGSNVGATTVWDQYALSLGYSFNRTGSALTLTTGKPVYVKAAPQTDGSAIMDSTTPIVQDLPTTADGKIYIFLGVAYSATNIELTVKHPVYHYTAGAIRPWVNLPIYNGGVS